MQIPFVATAGDAAIVTVTHQILDESQGKTVKDRTVEFVYRLEVTALDPDGYRMIWRPQSLTALGQTVDTTIDRENVDQDVPLELKTDASGTPTALLNYDAVFANGMRAVRYKAKTDKTMSDAQKESIVKGIQTFFASMSPENAAQVFCKYAVLISIFQGLTLTPGDDQPIDDSLPNPFGGSSSEWTGSLKLHPVDRTSETAKITFSGRSDASGMVADMAKTMSSAMGQEIDKSELADWKISLAESGEASVGLRDGWVRTAQLERRSTFAQGETNGARVERYKITVARTAQMKAD